MESEICQGFWGLGCGASTAIVAALILWVDFSLIGACILVGEEREYLWRLYCIYFLKLRPLGRICAIPILVILIALSMGILAIYIVEYIIYLITKTRPLFWSNEIQCKGYHCERNKNEN